ncbi:DEAD/DEAH box helicase family protein, partial [Streptomyces oceani]|uniref:DEAD/DEAH box helicase family protein n=1 Tax=Streptomyces oceani TaxID=1075402 RepID=UPI001480FF9A
MTAHPAVAEVFAASRPGVRPHEHQTAVLDRLAETLATGRRRAWVVLPPGLGKTLTGLETARRLGRPVVVLGPNTAIQGQWAREWAAFRPAPPPARTDRGLNGAVTVLTYQALASFDPDAEVDEEGGDRLGTAGRHLPRLRAGGRELVAALRALDQVTLLLDECHHLLDTWGELLAELLRELPRATVIGLTATPPDRLTPGQAALVEELFGPALRGPSIPAAVRSGHLAPYAELAWLTPPTAAETEWLRSQTARFNSLTTQLLDPHFAASPFLPWLDQRIVRRRTASGERALSWQRFAREHPDMARAALRFHHHGLLALPEGARLREEHRRAPAAADWVCLLDDWVRRCLRRSAEPADARALEAVRTALPAVGYRLTRAGVRAGRAPVDRLLARSAAKSAGALEIAAAEHAALGERLRAVVLCDHERATATLPADLSGVLDEQAGSARLLLGQLVADPRTAVLDPILVTGRTVAAAPETARRFVAYAVAHAPELRLDAPPQHAGTDGCVEITGAWTSRRWVALVTRFFEEGGSRLLVGTRGMLGEGWDARGVNTLVDLTEATTATAVVQLRGRALRRDTNRPDKTTHTWSVVCVAPGHPKGGGDWDRFVRKHDRYPGVTETGEVLTGVAHVHPGLSPYGPPAEEEFDGFNARMLRRARERDAVRALWRVGEPYEDRLVHTVRVTSPVALAVRQGARTGGLLSERTGGTGDQHGDRPASAGPPVAVPDRGGVTPGVPRGRAP